MGLKDICKAGESMLHISKLCDNSCQPPEQFDKRQTDRFAKAGQLSPIREEPFKGGVLSKTGKRGASQFQTIGSN